MDGIDYSLLAKQKQELLELIWDMPDSDLWGLVNLLDDMLDKHDNL